MKLPFLFISRKKYLQIYLDHEKSLIKLAEKLRLLKDDLSLTQQQSISEIEKLRQENSELKELKEDFSKYREKTSEMGSAYVEDIKEKESKITKLKEELLTAIFENQEYEKQLAELKFQKPLMQDDKDRQIKNLKLKIEAKEREIAEQKNITHFKNQIINGLKGYTTPRKDLEEKYPS